MLGHKTKEFRQHKSISLEDLVPDDNFYRQVERSIDLSFEIAGRFDSRVLFVFREGGKIIYNLDGRR